MHLPNQRLGNPDKLSQGAHNQKSYPRVQWESTLDKRGSRAQLGYDDEEAEGKQHTKQKTQEHRR